MSCNLECLYYIFGCLSFFVSLAIFIQIQLTKKNITNTDNRQKTETALKFIKDFHQNVLHKWDQYCAKYKTGTVNIENGCQLEPKQFNKSEFNNLDKEYQIFYCKLYLENYDLITDLLNALEVFSVGIDEHIVNEPMIMTAIGKTYCDIVRNISPIISCLRDESSVDSISTIKLYQRWNTTIQTKYYEKKIETLKQAISNLNSD